MTACDVLIVGGGPAGSTCARVLTRGGLHVCVLDKAAFPRDKTCAGWITPPVLETLGIDADEYRADRRTLQPIRGFRTSRVGDSADVYSRFDRIVSYGIRRCEFDHYLLQRSGAEIHAGEALTTLRRDAAGNRWIANERISASVVIGAGGHFCPVARLFGGASLGDEPIVAAQEIEVELTPEQAARCTIAADTPELFLTPDLKGYGWCFRKERVLNVGLGRQDRHDLARHVRDFVAKLTAVGKLPADLAWRWKGHAYLIHGTSRRRLVDDRMLLIGDAAGLAYPRSGEGIRPAIESGLMAAQVILEARDRYDAEGLEPYRTRILARFGRGEAPSATTTAWHALPESFTTSVAARLLAMPWFAREVFLTRWFLHAHERPLYA